MRDFAIIRPLRQAMAETAVRSQTMEAFTSPRQGREFDLLNLNPHDVEYLGGRVRSYGYPVRMFIHPMFELHDIKYKLGIAGIFRRTSLVRIEDIVCHAEGHRQLSEEQNKLVNKVMAARRGRRVPEELDIRYRFGAFTKEFNHYLSVLARILRAYNAPLFLAEESIYLDDTIKVLRNLGFHDDIVSYKTGKRTSVPEGCVKNKDLTKQGLRKIADALQNVGITDIIVNGQYLYFVPITNAIEQPNNVNVFKLNQFVNLSFYDIEAMGCVGWVIESLSPFGFNITASTATFPEYHP